MHELPGDETTSIRKTEAHGIHDVVEVEGWPTPAPPFDPAQPAPTEPIPIEDERLRVGPDGTVEHERVRRRGPRMPNPFSDFWPALALILLAALIGLGALWYFTRTQEKAVPSVVSLPLPRAVARLQNEGFKTDIVNRPNRAQPETVFAQRPSAGVEIDEGSTVTLLVSSGRANVEVPNLVGLTEKAARDRLAAAGLGVRRFEVPSDRPEGTVVGQNPGSGERVSKDARVRINVSQGRVAIQAPDVVGATESAARGQLSALHLSVQVVDVPSDQPPGTVVSQSPAAGSKVAKTGTVRLNVSRGRASVSVPDTVGLRQEQARAELTSHRLTPRIVEQTSTKPVGTVISQSPAAGAEISRGDTVTLVVSKGAGLVAVPDVVGLSRSEAEAAIRGAGLQVGRVIKVPSDSPVGTVVAQYPTGGQQRKQASPVQINVSIGRP
jgi:serine/threonine-protein kinase